jgi:uncharacterized protein involved in exopolysaccharide biosynthesis
MEQQRSSDPGRREPPRVGERLVYVVPSDAMFAEQGETDLVALAGRIWQGRWVVVGVAAILTALAIAYALLADQWYRAQILLVPSDVKSMRGMSASLGNLGAVGGLASLAGINIGADNTAEPLAVLTSRDFTRDFIADQKLLPVLFADDWDAKAGRWKDSDPDEWPDMHDAIKFFDEDIRYVEEDKKTKLITLSIEWKDPKVAADWANLLVRRLNDRMRQRSLKEAESHISYLKRELATADVVPLQQSISRVLENELQTAMLARVSEEFAFRVIDSADPPKWRAWPKRAQIVVLAMVFGVLIGSFVVLVRHAFRPKAAATGSAG